MKDDGAALRLEAFLPYRLMVVAEKVSLGFSRQYKDAYALSRPEWRVLASLAQFQRATAKDIGVHSSMHKTKVSRAVHVLEQRKWLVRRGDVSDRRVEWLELTREGKARFAILAGMAKAYQEELLRLLGEDHAMALDAAISRLSDMQPSGDSRKIAGS